MRERRGVHTAVDTGARTRRTDRIPSPHGLQEWGTTFHLRWAEHLDRQRDDGKRQPV